MPVFVILILFSLSFYLFYKIKYYRTKKTLEKQWISAKSSIALGLFVFFFGINQIFMFRSTVSLIVGIIFIIIGLGSVGAGYKAYKYFLPLVVKEAKEM